MFTVGSIFIYSVGPYISFRGTSYIGLALSVAHVMLLLLIPESPVFYAFRGELHILIISKLFKVNLPCFIS